MKKYNLIILAGGENEKWCKQYGYNKKPFLPLNGKPMLDRVVQSFRNSIYIDKIIVVGPRELDQLDCMKYVDKRIPEGGSFIQNLIHGIAYLKAFIYKFKRNHNGYLISFCDAAFLNTYVINKTIENLDPHDPGMVLHYVPKEVIARRGFLVENRTFMYVAGRPYTGANIYYVKKFSAVLRVIKDLAAMRKYRKTPEKMLEHLGCKDKPYSGIEKVLSKMMRVKVKIFVSPYAEMGVDIDKPIDYELAKSQLEKTTKDCLAFEDKDLENVCAQEDEIDVDA